MSLGGDADALVFAGGIGEKSAALRRSVVEKVKCLGFGIDEKRNEDPEARREEEGDGKVVDVSVLGGEGEGGGGMEEGGKEGEEEGVGLLDG